MMHECGKRLAACRHASSVPSPDWGVELDEDMSKWSRAEWWSAHLHSQELKSPTSTYLLVMFKISIVTVFYHSCPSGLNGKWCFMFNSAILTIHESPVESGGRVEWGGTDCLNQSRLKEPIKRREVVGFLSEFRDTLSTLWDTIRISGQFINNLGQTVPIKAVRKPAKLKAILKRSKNLKTLE